MRDGDSGKYLQAAGLLTLLGALCTGAGASAAEGQLGRAESASWVPKELSLTDPAFAAHHSCEALRSRMKAYLLQLGARSDLEVRTWGCTEPVAPDIFPGVTVHMNVLSPGPGGQPVITAHWKRVDLRASRSSAGAAADCELISQIRLKVLPLFPIRNVQYSANCERGRASPGYTRLTAEVLVPDASPATAAR